ncbi:MAG: tRNA 2-thiouridine(34) synthase MnmA [Acidobacteria bacterium]|nr:tRNA 2-thiouridine(34) synthase MnmA [Acidobacteriota bacterium]
MRVAVAMSGGVDSSVAAALLAEQGHDVIGLSMQLYDQRDGQPRFGTCCTIDDLHDARRVATRLGVPHYIINFESHFHARVVTPFVDEYVAGRTPIPCTRCNSDVKFVTLLERSAGLQADRLATGHYVQSRQDAHGAWHLHRGADPGKDQSYFLFALTQDQLSRALFPVGHLDKASVRAYALDRQLPVALKPDSQEICFVPDGDQAAFVARAAGARTPGPGRIVDREGRVLGTHGGVHRFTVGQRKGLQLSVGVPLYVVAIDATAEQVTVGPRSALEQRAARIDGVQWIAGRTPEGPIQAEVQIRHRHAPGAATVLAVDSTQVEVQFAEPQYAITPGQAAVFYHGDEVLGGGWIASPAAPVRR